MEMALFNVNDGFAEAIVRGYRSSFLSQEDYRRISAADTLEGLYYLVFPAT
jgi:V-type H+-transporting ATPase subunit d